MFILVINCGSSSIKFAVIDSAQGTQPISGLAERLGTADARLEIKRDGAKENVTLAGPTHEDAMKAIADSLDRTGWKAKIKAVGHRVVHGGDRFVASCRVDEDVIRGIEAVIPLSPLHNPAHLTGIRAAGATFPGLPMVTVFDTAFHQTMPEVNWRYPVPHDWAEKYGVRKYGFHGTNHRHVAREAARQLGLEGKDHGFITMHLGNGCSAAAILNGRCVDTSMGLTPLDGMMMGTRSGALDPTVVSHVAKATGKAADAVVGELNTKSGLLGVSGISNDMRTLLEKAESGDARSRLAVDMFCNRAAKTAASLAASLPRLDAVIFTGGIGENSAPVRSSIAEGWRVMGGVIQPMANLSGGKDTGGKISADASRFLILIVPAAEELAIARETAALLGA